MRRIDRATLVTVAAWVVAGVWIAWTLIRLFGLEFGPLIPMMAFTPFVALTAPLPIALALALRRPAAAIATGVTAVVLALLVLPRAFGGPSDAEGEPGPSLRVLAANVEFGQADADELVALAEELDLDALAVSELTPAFADKLERSGIRELLPHGAIGAETSAKGTGLYSRLPLTGTSTDPLPGGFILARGTATPPGGVAVELNAVHTVPPTTPNMRAWTEDLNALPATDDGGPARVLFGDFNATLDHAAFRDVLDRGYDDAGATMGSGLTFTWPAARRRTPPLVTIDHVLADERLGITGYSVEELDGSDHRPVFAELVLPAAD
jgi:endonuclease/exonuclease/phosphatase (EEP) superfamily protein YafD